MPINRNFLEQVIGASAEPLVIIRVDHPDWPVVLSNAAFEAIGGEETGQKPFADVIEQLVGRELALEISETLRLQQETSFPVELAGREYLLALKPLLLPNERDARFYVAYWRGGAGAVAGSDMHHALLKAKRRIRDLSRDDPERKALCPSLCLLLTNSMPTLMSSAGMRRIPACVESVGRCADVCGVPVMSWAGLMAPNLLFCHTRLMRTVCVNLRRA